ncbi:hypothetical protein [Candidatus Neptunochlamydia vexilliferae]|uniref:Uncharacterized protein n=1 Tax=Candidatus Neptunichlamydia vexilliferae TaxID=1651774 RepID=A0ABS0AXJ1_9BACT|nr:hypothetical protein [Candidatus Neptunochlamydia vexilliferae]MBF5058674.1 hypothetical protein [Candidatus Neptunochlamydia vexilliferae]
MRISFSAAELLAAAVLDYIPKATLVQGGGDAQPFYYDFIFGAPFSEEMLPLIEERMRALASKKLPLEVKEMVPFSGAEFLRHQKHHHRAKRAKKASTPLVQILYMGEFVDYVPFELVKNTQEIPLFKLTRVEKRPDLEGKEVYRIVGLIAETKKELKALAKQRFEDPLEAGEKKGFFLAERRRNGDGEEEEKIYWKAKGEALIHTLYKEWRAARLKEGFELVVTPDQDHQALCTRSGAFAEWHFPMSTLTICCLKKELEAAKKRLEAPFEVVKKGELYILIKKMSQKKELFCRMAPYAN